MDDNDVGRKMVEQCYQKNRTTINPIVDWTDEDVWEFLNEVAKVPHCSLYDEGYTRLGCIGCPLQGREGMLRDFERYPKYKALYIKAFDRMIANHPGEIKVATGEMVENTSGGVQQYTQDGSLGMPDGFGNEFVQATGESGTFTDYLSRERERERESGNQNSPSGRDTRFTTSGFGVYEQTQANHRRTDLYRTDIRERDDGEQARSTASVVADADGGAELPVLDRELLSGDAADTHTHTHTHGGHANQCSKRAEISCLSDGCGCTDRRRSLSGLLALALPEQSAGSDCASIEAIQPESGEVCREFNRDPRVADYESGAALLNEWVNEWR